eukprot:13470.XXX_1026842_1026964_1 [CDS] Oithona nana genome sequencing.
MAKNHHICERNHLKCFSSLKPFQRHQFHDGISNWNEENVV